MGRAASEFGVWIGVAAVAVALVLPATAAWAQAPESELPPAAGEHDPEAPPATPDYVVPDVPDSFADKAQVESRWFTLRPGLVLIEDYSAFSQDAASRGQVGEQDDQWQVRAARFMLRGTIGGAYKVRYLVAAEYKGFESEPEDTWQITDVSVTFPLGGPSTQLTLGRTKESMSYEMVGDAANLPQMERVLSPFFVSRTNGIKLTSVLGKEHRMTAAVGVFNDSWLAIQDHADRGTDASARFTGLLWDRSAGKDFFHLGVSARYVEAGTGSLRYKGRPETNVGNNYVDTGNFPADDALHGGLELLWNHGPVSLLGEYIEARVDSPETGDPRLCGWYLTASWVLTGETRPYDRTVGYARRVMPQGRWGAPELVARFSHEDLDDAGVHGGAFDKTYLGLNWWATRRWKAGIGWGHTRLDRFGTTGTTDSLLTRLQWVY